MNATALREVSLDDKYTALRGPVLISGPQAIVRLVLLQRELDRRAGLHGRRQKPPTVQTHSFFTHT